MTTHVLLWPIKLLYVGVREFVAEDGTTRASALAYATLLAVVPAVVLLITVLDVVQSQGVARDFIQGFLWPEEATYRVVEVNGSDPELPPVGSIISKRELEQLGARHPDALVTQLQPSQSEKLLAGIEELADNLREHLSTVRAIGAVVLVATILSLIHSIEQTISSLWHVRAQRNLMRKFLVMWALISMGPILLAASVAVTLKLGIDTFLYLPYLFTFLAFFCLYKLVPNTYVAVGHAALAALFAAALWELVKILFGKYINVIYSNTSSTVKTYGSLALVPIFIFWVYVSWTITLFGAKLAYVGQYLHTFTGRGWRALTAAPEVLEQIGARTMARIISAQYHDGHGPTFDELVRGLGLPPHHIEHVVTLLAERELLVRDVDTGRLHAATPPDRLDIDTVTRAVRGDAGGLTSRSEDGPTDRAIAELFTRVADERRRVLGATTFAALEGSAS